MRTRYLVAGSLLIIGMVAMVQAQPGGRGGFGGGVTFLVTQKAIQEDLKVSEEQATKLKDWGKDFFTKSLEIYKDKGIDLKAGFGKAATDEERAKRAEADAEVSKVAYKDLGEILKKEQVDRLKQIERQRMGVNAFTNTEVVETLKLTDSQKTSVKGISGDYATERREIVAEATKDGKGKGKGKGIGFGLDPEVQKKITKVEKEAIGKVVDLLDDTQKKTWKELIGAEFDMSKLTFGIPGFGKDKKKD